MMSFEKCKHSSKAPVVVLEALLDSQAGTGRHKCCVCAYYHGYNDGKTRQVIKQLESCNHGNRAPLDVLKKLPSSQAGAGRHKCAVCAYVEGLSEGLGGRARESDLYEKDITKIIDVSKVVLKKTDPPPFQRRNIVFTRSFKSTIKVDYTKAENRNHALGFAGERMIIEYESRLLIEKNRRDLAEKIIHVSRVEGDSAGYDIKSYALNEKVKFIEVKTTSGDEATPFIMTSNELDFAKKNKDFYCIYRIFNYSLLKNSCSFYIVSGDPETEFNLVPTEYKAFRT